ncbi:MAG: SRPBCC family protein [Marmoricola sp.]
MTTPGMSDHIVSESITVRAPPDTVFAILADPRQHPRIDGSGSVQAVVRGPERLVQDAEFGMDMKLLGVPYKIRNWVVEFEEDRLITWRHFGGPRWRYQLTPTEGGTQVTESFDYSMCSAARRWVIETTGFPSRNRAGIRATLDKLKASAEADAH